MLKLNRLDVKSNYLVNNWNKLTKGEINALVKHVNWFNISMNFKLSDGFIKKFKNFIQWSEFSINPNLTEKDILKYKDNLILEYTVVEIPLSSKFIIDNISIFSEQALLGILKFQRHLNPEVKQQIQMIYELRK